MGSRLLHRLPPRLGVLLLVLAFAALSCDVAPFLAAVATPTETATYIVQCTPPPCAADETYACSAGRGNCPGGCGTICIKKTADPNATLTPTAGAGSPCVIVVRTPAPEAPTASVNGTAQPDRQVDPHVAACADSARVSAGDTVTIRAQAVDIGLPIFQLNVLDDGASDSVALVRASFDGTITPLDGLSAVLGYQSAQASNNDLVVTLQALAPGTAAITIGADGEIHYGYPGPATWSGGGSEPLVITVSP